MAIVINLDVLYGKAKNEHDRTFGKSRHHHGKPFRLKKCKSPCRKVSTLEALCRVLNCQPGDLLEYREDTPQI
jgi:putative transcriptional regulator